MTHHPHLPEYATAHRQLEDDDSPMFGSRVRILLFALVLAIATIAILFTLMRRYHRYRNACCRPHPLRVNQQNRTALEEDYELAQRLQHELNAEMREQEKQAKRKERQVWYESYLKPYTTVVKLTDIFYSDEVEELAVMKDGDDEGVTTSNRKAIFLKMASVLTSESSMGDDEDEDDDREENEATSDVEMGQQPQQKPRKQQKGKHFGGDENCGRQDDSELVALDNTINTEHDENENDNGNENENDIEMGETTDTVDVTATTHNDNYNDIDNSQCHSISNQDHDQHSISTHLCVRIPCANGTRSVDAHCAICLGEYMTGDKVSFSNLECRHAFHYDCILPWLSKGKKRCPICRHWFVPGTKIDDQKKAAAAAAEAAALAAQPSSSSDDEEEIEIVDSTDRVAAAPTIIGGRTDESSQASLDQEEFDADQQQEQEEQRVDASPHDV